MLYKIFVRPLPDLNKILNNLTYIFLLKENLKDLIQDLCNILEYFLVKILSKIFERS